MKIVAIYNKIMNDAYSIILLIKCVKLCFSVVCINKISYNNLQQSMVKESSFHKLTLL